MTFVALSALRVMYYTPPLFVISVTIAISTSRVENRVDPDQLSTDLHLHCFQNRLYPVISRQGLNYLIALSAR